MKKQSSKRKINPPNLLIVTAVLLLSVLVVFLILLLCNHRYITIHVNGEDTVYTEYDSTYEDPGVSATIDNTALFLFHTKIDVTSSGTVNTEKLGTYSILYTASQDDLTSTYTRTVIVRDTTPPDITLVSNTDSYTLYNHPYEEEGYTAIDAYDGDVTDKVKSEEKDGKVIYTVTDSHNNTATVERTIHYDDRTAPVITLSDGENIIVYNGEDYTDTYSAEDDCDGDVTASVKADGTVDTHTNGTYTINYTVTDAHGNTATAARTVVVKDMPVNVITEENNKTIYLTYDDGPGPYTSQLLDIFDKYNVKVTFFTTSTRSGYTDLIGEEARRGHTVAVHTYTHQYSSIYASTDAYWSDFNAQNAVIASQTGSTSRLFRFPGGSSNTISENYSKGIMTTLSQQANARGLEYFDWNVSSGDAGGTTDTNTVYQNVVNQVTANSNVGYPSVVLQHDVKEFSVNAVESIIRWGLENGYSFQALQPGRCHAHQRIAN